MNDIKLFPGVQKINVNIFDDVRGSLHKINLLHPELLKFKNEEVFFTKSRKNVFRGMHLQWGTHSASKIITLTSGSILWFLIDCREGSNQGKIYSEEILEPLQSSYLIPKGVAQGYLSLENNTIVHYQMDSSFCGECDTGFRSEQVLDSSKLKSGQDLIISERDSFFPTSCVENKH